MQIINFITGVEQEVLLPNGTKKKMTVGEGFVINHFPDGEKQLVINELNKKEPVEVICRVKSSDDLFMLMQLKDVLDRQWVKISRLSIKYLMGMRNDRFMDLNAAITLKTVAEVLNGLRAKKVEILTVHSDKTTELINNSTSVGISIEMNNGVICYPDKGALDRYSRPLEKHKHIYAEKTRTVDGINVILINAPDKVNGEIYVKDDLCDGGGTFLAIAPKLRELNPTKLILCVTHAIQKIGIEKVAEVYDEVYITNSYADWDKEELPKNVKVINVL